MKQLDVDVNPPANIMTFRLGLTNVTFDLDPYFLRYDFFSSERQTDRGKATHKSPPWMSSKKFKAPSLLNPIPPDQ